MVELVGLASLGSMERCGSCVCSQISCGCELVEVVSEGSRHRGSGEQRLGSFDVW